MILGIMQPYFVPYIGYWQLMNAVDKYVVYDDVNYIKGGWINRNRVLSADGFQYFNVQMLGASPNKLINEVLVDHDERIIAKNVRKLENIYGRAPFYLDVMPIMERILKYNAKSIADYNVNSIEEIKNYLEIDTELVLSSILEKDNSLRGQDKVLAICKLMEADEYYNAIGGRELYSFEAFRAENVKLSFLKPGKVVYSQLRSEFIPDLSIIDVMMFNSRDSINEMLNNYELVTE